MKTRCRWAEADPLSTIYHDTEWGVPQHDDHILFEHLILDGLQAGLSWSIILKKREYLRIAFDNFDPFVIASYGATKIDELLSDKGVTEQSLRLLSKTPMVSKTYEKNICALMTISGSL
jgi:DNA-3-methyladenine glycosylase I